MELLEQLKGLMGTEDNWKSYRGVLKLRDPPCLPYLGLFFDFYLFFVIFCSFFVIGLYLTDLTFIEDGNKDFLESKEHPDQIINFVKCQQLSFVIQDIQQYQQRMYYFQEVPAIQEYFRNYVPLSDDNLYALSLKLEPRDVK